MGKDKKDVLDWHYVETRISQELRQKRIYYYYSNKCVSAVVLVIFKFLVCLFLFIKSVKKYIAFVESHSESLNYYR